MNDCMQVLLIEDHAADARLVREALTDAGIAARVTHLEDGAAAASYLARAAHYRPDAIILDLNMPRMNGHEFLETMKDYLDARDIPVIMLTVSDDSKDVNLAMQQRLNFFMTKPVNPERMAQVIYAIGELW